MNESENVSIVSGVVIVACCRSAITVITVTTEEPKDWRPDPTF